MGTRWLEGGTFDVTAWEEMETLIKKYKTSDTGKKREDKKERERGTEDV